MDLEEFEKIIGYNFNNKNLLKTALTHTSYSFEKKIESNEKLEYLGDSILEFVISEYLFKNYKRLKEGEMTKIRAAVVCEKSLHDLAIKCCFSEYILLGKSEKRTDGNKKPAILADCVEAMIAAIYLDSNSLDAPKKFIINNLKNTIDIAANNVGMKDYKTVLQEILQKKGNVNIEYITIRESGPDHSKTFEIELLCDNKLLARGTGSTKKAAEMQAAKEVIQSKKFH